MCLRSTMPLMDTGTNGMDFKPSIGPVLPEIHLWIFHMHGKIKRLRTRQFIRQYLIHTITGGFSAFNFPVVSISPFGIEHHVTKIISTIIFLSRYLFLVHRYYRHLNDARHNYHRSYCRIKWYRGWIMVQKISYELFFFFFQLK